MKKDVREQILKNHSSSNIELMKIYNIDKNREITVRQENQKIVMQGFNHKSDRFLNLETKEFKDLIDSFKELSNNDLYFSDKYCYITLDTKKTKKRNSKIVGYARVSSKGQLDNYSLEQQEQQILEKYSNTNIYKEQFTGTTTDRPIFNEIMNQLQLGDMLVVTKLDRLARNTVEGIQIIESLFKKGVSVHVLNIGLLENTTMGKFFLTTLLAVAEMERNTLIERTQQGKAIAKTKPGYKEGRPKAYTNKQLNHALSLLSINGGDKSYKEVEEITKISKSTLIRENNKRKLLSK